MTSGGKAARPEASIISTGDAGGEFESRVGAALLALLLTRSFVPIFTDLTPTAIHFQARRLKWRTDDVVIDAVDRDGVARKLCVQIKRTFSISAGDDECVKTFEAAWQDFNNAELFDQALDAFAIVVHLGTNRLLADFGWLLTQARASADAADFQSRLDGGSAALNKKSKQDFQTIRGIVAASDPGAEGDQDRLWRFLKAIHILSYDFTSDSGKDEANAKTVLNMSRANDSAPSAAATWNDLIVLAGQAKSTGRSHRVGDLPSEMTSRHRGVEFAERAALETLRGHSKVVLNRVSDAGPQGLDFPRSELRDLLREQSASHQVVLVIGAAGGGKSVLAKRHVAEIAAAQPAFAFAAEEFRVAHIDAVLGNASLGMNWDALAKALPLRPKFFLIEGLERLLEASDRQAFNDLLNAAAADPSIRLVLTCRDYHAETVERSVIRPSGIQFGRVVVPGLADAELDIARAKFPKLERPLAVPALRSMLRNPFMLARAAEAAWDIDSPLPETERALRTELWNIKVRREDQAAGGLPERRAAALTEISLDRARSLVPFAPLRPGGDVVARDALASDNLIVYDSAQRVRAAPAHDVFEDWALIEWISAQFQIADGDTDAFVASIGAAPAMRRAYRKWLFEVLETEPESAASHVSAVAGSATIEAHFKDDTLVAVFQSSAAASFLAKHGSLLLAGDAALLRRTIHLVRVACMTASPLAQSGTSLVAWVVPTGRAWPTLLAFLARHWDGLPSSLWPLLIGLLEDWAKGITWQEPYPDGASDAGALIERLFPVSKHGWRDESERRRVAELLVKIPKSAPTLFLDLAAKTRAHRRGATRDQDAEIFFAALMKPYSSGPAARDFPEELASLSLSAWTASEEDAERGRYSYREMEERFGVEGNFENNLHPASALQGPFHNLLVANPREGIGLVCDLVNAAVDRYAKEGGRPYDGPTESVDMVLADGSSKPVHCDERLWCAYRATTVAPEVLESALMALEKWLLGLMMAEAYQELARTAMGIILLRANNAALVSVVASVCMAHPEESGDAAMAVLGTRRFFELDLRRGVHESWAPAVGGLGVFEQMFQDERAASNRLPHRRGNLENLAQSLQFSGARDKVWAALDRHRAALPPADRQDREDKLWRLALDRMDARRWTKGATRADGWVELKMKKLDDDIQELVDDATSQQERPNKKMSLWVWGRTQFDDPQQHSEQTPEWRERLAFAREIEGEPPEPETAGMSDAAPNFVAAVCARDHWDDMDAEQRQWCASIVARAIDQPLTGDNAVAVMGRNPMSGVAQCARVAALMASRDRQSGERRRTLVAALTHFNNEVRLHACQGASECLIGKDEELADLCIRALLLNADIWHRFDAEQSKRPWHEREGGTAAHYPAARAEREAGLAGSASVAFDPGTLVFSSWPQRLLARELIQLFLDHPEDPRARALFSRVAQHLKTWWSMERRRRDGPQRDFELESLASRSLAGFALSCPPADALAVLAPVLDNAAATPKGLAEMLRLLRMSERTKEGSSPYWQLWDAFSASIKAAPWLVHVDRDSAEGQECVSEAFLNTGWPLNARAWDRLGPRHASIDALFVDLPKSSFVLGCYVDFLAHIGQASMPDAFALIVDKAGSDLATFIAADGNLRFHLDMVVARALYEDLDRIRKDSKLRAAVLAVLDALVVAGSSTAFRLRDDFVTPEAGRQA